MTGNRANHLQDACHPTKKDWWLMALLLPLSVFFLWMSVGIFLEPVAFTVKVFGSLFFLLFGIAIPWMIFTTRYILTGDALVIQVLWFKSSLPLADITEVFPTHNPLSAPAFSLDRLRIKFKSIRFGALISPRDKSAFYRDLLQRCPHLVRQGDKLVAHSGM